MLGRYISLGNPVANHPLNEGLVSWWLPLPNNQGGGTLFDLCNRAHGTLTNGPTWSAGPNGFGALTFDGSNDYVSLGTTAALAITGDITASCWLRSTNAGGYYQIFGCYDIFSPFAGWSLAISPGVGAGIPGFWSNNIGYWVAASTAMNDDAWHMVTVTGGGSSGTFYLDGRSDGTFAYAAPSAFAGSKNLMARSDGTFNYGATVRAWQLHNRALSATEVAALYEQSLRGHPDTLRRLTRAAWSFGGGGGAGTFTGSGAPSTDTTTCAGTGTFTAPAYTGSGAPSTEVATTAGSGTHTAPTYTGTGTPATDETTCAGTGTFTAPVYTATGALATDTTTSAGTGTHTAPTYTGTGSPATDAPTATGSGTFTAPVYTGSASLATDTATLAGSGTFTAPAYTGSGTPSTEVATVAGTGTHTAPPGTYTGAGSQACETATCAGTGTFTSAASLSPRIVADTVDFAYTQADTVEFAYVHADTIDFVYTIGPDYLE